MTVAPETRVCSREYHVSEIDNIPEILDSSAFAFLARLAERGVEVVFANAGTDFAPLIEALAHPRARSDVRFPRFVIAPHENLAMAMANGYYRATGKVAAVMVHVSVGTSNTICQLINMNRDNVPVILCAGRSPATEAGHPASRNAIIHWGQESFDQAGMLREFVKWEYEFRARQPVAALVDRAIDIAMAEPRGPVYLSLPREALVDQATPLRSPEGRAFAFTDGAPDPKAIDELARMVADASFPLIVTTALGRTAAEFDALSALTEDHAIPTVQVWATDTALPTGHSMHLGYGERLQELLDRADLILAIKSPTPWLPQFNRPPATARVVTIDADPFRASYPFLEREANLVIAGDAYKALRMLHAALGDRQTHEARREFAATFRKDLADKRSEEVERGAACTPIDSAWLTHCVDRHRSAGSVVVNELGLRLSHLTIDGALGYIGSSHGGGLGAALGTALGVKIGDPDRDVIVAVGDGSYMFGNPLPYHFVQRAEGLPILTIVANNHCWLAVKESTLAVYPNGHAAASNEMPLQSLAPSPRFEMVAESCGGFAMSVTDPELLPDAIATCLNKVRSGVPALLNVHTQSR